MSRIILDYTKKYPSHFLGYFLSGTGLLITSFYVKKCKYDYLRVGFAGSFAQIATECFYHPLDVVNTRTKVDLIGKSSTFSMTRKIFKSENILGFSRGLSAVYYGSLFAGGAYFTIYKFLKDKLVSDITRENANRNFLAYVVSSSLGELFFMLTYYPFDLITTRMQVKGHKNNYHDVYQAFKTIIMSGKNKIEGMRNMYVGAAPSFIKNIINTCLIFSITESMREYFKRTRNIQHVNDLSRLDYYSCFIIAGAISGAITNVLEVITINKQIQGNKFHLRKFLKENGIYSLRAGIMANVVMNTLQTITLFTVVDHISLYFDVEL